jgi:hypothetical protein
VLGEHRRDLRLDLAEVTIEMDAEVNVSHASVPVD